MNIDHSTHTELIRYAFVFQSYGPEDHQESDPVNHHPINTFNSAIKLMDIYAVHTQTHTLGFKKLTLFM